MKKLLAVLTAILLILPLTERAMALETLSGDDIPIAAPYAILMEKSTGTVLYEKDSHEHCAPASVTKVMTLLLVMEALDAGVIRPDDMVTASETAASMGGSQIWLEAGERMSVSEMLKCVAVVSANDCAVALAELLCGTEDAFVKRMNERALELGMHDTHFTNCTGLRDDDDHYTSAYDIAVKNGFTGTEQEWLQSLQGADGKDAPKITVHDVYEEAVASGAFSGTFSEFLESQSQLVSGFLNSLLYPPPAMLSMNLL